MKTIKEFCKEYEIVRIHIIYKGKEVASGPVKGFHSLFLEQDIYENFYHLEIIFNSLFMEVKGK